MIMPGVQKPHCSPCISRKPSCRACSVPSAFAMPSMVRMSAPFACTANTVQDFTDLPSRSTVQAPQWLVSQPICGPVRFSCSRRKWMSSVRGSTSASIGLPLTFMETWDLAMSLSPVGQPRARDLGARERAREHHAGHLGAVVRRPAGVGGRRGDRLGGGDGLLHRRGVERRAEQDLRRLLGPERRFGDIGEADRAACDLAAGHGEHDGGGGGGIVADLALELLVGVAVAGGRHRNADGREHVAGLERGEIGALIEVARRDPAFAALARDVIAGAEAHHHRRHVVAGIAIGDIAADRADIAHLRIGDLQRGLAQERDLGGEKLGGDQLVLGRHGADDDVAAVGADALELGDAGEIDEVRRRGEAQLHHRDQAVAAGERRGRRRRVGRADRPLP